MLQKKRERCNRFYDFIRANFPDPEQTLAQTEENFQQWFTTGTADQAQSLSRKPEIYDAGRKPGNTLFKVDNLHYNQAN